MPSNNHKLLIEGLVPNDGKYSIVLDIPMTIAPSKFIDKNLICDLNVEIYENGSLVQKSEVKNFSKIAEKTAKRIDIYSSDQKFLFQKGAVKLVILRRSECLDDRLNTANLNIQRVVGSPTENFLFR